MPQVTFEEIECKSALNRISIPDMPQLRWSLNPYRGCQHACVYCFARGTHAYLGYDTGRDFNQRIVVKTNLVPVLRRELRRAGWKREAVTIGTACDPYQQAERKYGLTRGALQMFLAHANPCSIITKSPSIERDLSLLRDLSRVAECTVIFSIATLREEIWQHIEPETAKPIRRLEAMEKLSTAGVQCGVMLAPIIPGLTDDAENMEAVVKAARDYGAAFVGDNVLYLKPGTKEWFMPFLRETYPHLLPTYERFYRGAYAPKNYTKNVTAAVEELREQFGMTPDRRPAQEPIGQLQLAV
ncbi:MAG: radical SAM protein [Chloroflexi bacterium]|nr:radical SAM protein [Chloroflexota bacterium]